MAYDFRIDIDDTYVDYVKFGKGKKNLIIIPGLGESLKTTHGTGRIISRMYKCFKKDYTVYVFSRRYRLKENFSTEDMAEDIVELMNKLNIDKASIAGVSQGGMISQYIAINHPKRVDKLALVVTLSKQNEIVKERISKWLEYANNNDYKNIFIDTMENSYQEEKLKKYRKLYKVLIKISEPKTLTRFKIEANACLNHNAYDKLKLIKAPTLVIGGEKDNIVGVNASKEIHKKIKNSELYIYEDYGHGLYEEAKDFNKRIVDFLNKE